MYQIKQSEATAARRRIPVLFVGSTDGFTPTPQNPKTPKFNRWN